MSRWLAPTAALALFAALAQADDPKAPQAPAAPSTATPADAPMPAEGPAPRPAVAGDAARRDGSRWRPDGPMSPEMVERVLAVARDVSPELAAQLEKMRAESPEQVSQAMRQNARRLMALAVIKERNPDLYAVRVEDARLQLELRKLGDQYRAATQASDAAGAETIAAQIAAKVRAQVDVDLKARAQELVALDEQMQALREELVTEERRTTERVAERIDAVKKGQPIQERGMFGEGGSRRPKPDGADAPKAANPKNSA
jgi:hypothetical protein